MGGGKVLNFVYLCDGMCAKGSNISIRKTTHLVKTHIRITYLMLVICEIF